MLSFAEHTWASIARNRELFVNALDLISFLLVTPVLVDIVLPRLAELVYAILTFTFVWAITMVVTLTIFMVETKEGVDIRENPWALGNAFVILCTMILGMSAIYFFRKEIAGLLSGFIRHYFVVGLGLFFLARIMAITTALFS